VAELEGAMTAEEFGEWMAFYGQQPFGISGAWFQTGVVASTIANVNRGANSPALSAADFMPRRREDEAVKEKDPTEFFKA
jgi:hypothetical protein